MAIIRPATRADAGGIARVHVESWRTTYRGIMPDDLLASLSIAGREQGWEPALHNLPPDRCVFVAEEDGEIVGFVSGGPERIGLKKRMGEVYAIYLLADHQRKGIGRVLMAQAVGHLAAHGCRTLLVWVAEDNPACGFYEALGGKRGEGKVEMFGDVEVHEVSYVWESLADLKRRLAQGRA